MKLALYIPLWYDSNETKRILKKFLVSLYIPLWYDSNDDVISKQNKSSELYIPLWYDSNAGEQVGKAVGSALHSTLVRF